jgi:hypothetical protein
VPSILFSFNQVRTSLLMYVDGESYLHCFEGTIKAFAAASANRAAKWGCARSTVLLRMWSGMRS